MDDLMEFQTKCFHDLIGQYVVSKKSDQSKLRFSMLNNRLDN